MARSKFTSEDYVQWLIAESKWATMTEASRCSPTEGAHDSWRRLLLRQATDSEALWEEVQDLVDFEGGYLILDDSTLDKPYGPKIELVSWHWSGKHNKVVQGINLVTLLWTDGEKFLPVDFCIYHKDSHAHVNLGRCRSRVDTVVALQHRGLRVSAAEHAQAPRAGRTRIFLIDHTSMMVTQANLTRYLEPQTLWFLRGPQPSRGSPQPPRSRITTQLRRRRSIQRLSPRAVAQMGIALQWAWDRQSSRSTA
jgi:hypothetical protein